MPTHKDPLKNPPTQAAAHKTVQRKNSSQLSAKKLDNRTESIQQQQQKDAANASPQVKQLEKIQDSVNSSLSNSGQVVQAIRVAKGGGGGRRGGGGKQPGSKGSKKAYGTGKQRKFYRVDFTDGTSQEFQCGSHSQATRIARNIAERLGKEVFDVNQTGQKG